MVPRQVTTTIQEPRQITTTVMEPRRVSRTVMEGGKVERVCDLVLGLSTLRLTLCHSAGQQSREEAEEVMAPKQVTNTVMEPRQVTSTVMEPQQQVPLRLPSSPLLQAAPVFLFRSAGTATACFHSWQFLIYITCAVCSKAQSRS